MKQTMSEHKTQLDGIAESLKKEAAYVNSLKFNTFLSDPFKGYIRDQFEGLKRGHAEYQRQFDEAVRRGMKKFDRDKFLK